MPSKKMVKLLRWFVVFWQSMQVGIIYWTVAKSKILDLLKYHFSKFFLHPTTLTSYFCLLLHNDGAM
jgi:hypothetical protein